MSASQRLPDGVRRSNGGQPCDMLVGPCSCGATHVEGEPGTARIRIAANLTRLVIEWAAARNVPLPTAEAQLAELAELGTSKLTPAQRATMLRKLARGVESPKLETLDRLALALEVDVQRFFDPLT